MAADYNLDSVLQLIGESHFAAAVAKFEALGAPDLSPAGALKVSKAYKKLHNFHGETEILQSTLDDTRNRNAIWPIMEAKLVRGLGRALMRVERWDDALRHWFELCTKFEPTRNDLLALLACAHRTNKLASVHDIMDQLSDEFGAHFAPKELELLSSNADFPAELKPGLYVVGGGNGAGKTAIGDFLAALGLRVINTDTEVAEYEYSGVFNKSPTDFQGNANKAKFVWPKPTIERFRQRAMDQGCALVLCGWASNSSRLVDLATCCVYLRVPMPERIRRLQQREPRRWREGSPDYERLMSRAGKSARRVGMNVVENTDSIGEVSGAVLELFRQRSEHHRLS